MCIYMYMYLYMLTVNVLYKLNCFHVFDKKIAHMMLTLFFFLSRRLILLTIAELIMIRNFN